MTLVLACVTQDAVYQVSDRRLTDLRSPTSIVDDERNKAVLVNGRVAFAYTGLAEIEPNKRTDVWLAQVIGAGPNDDMALLVEFRRHAFQGVGWFRLKGEKELSPGIICIDNALDDQTGSWIVVPRPARPAISGRTS